MIFTFFCIPIPILIPFLDKIQKELLYYKRNEYCFEGDKNHVLYKKYFTYLTQTKQLLIMKKREPISHIMTKSVVTVNQNDELKEVVRKLKSNAIRHIPVVNGSEVVGIISRSDINRLTFGALFEGQQGADEAILEMLSITQIMTSKPKTVSPETSIRDLVEIFAIEEFHALPVVDKGVLKGIVTTTDVMRYFLEQYD